MIDRTWRSRRALLATAAIPTGIAAWLLLSAVVPSAGVWPIAFVAASMLLMTVNRTSVEEFASAASLTSRPNLVNQFSRNYFAYHATQARWPASLFLALTYVPIVLVAGFWLILIVGLGPILP